MDLLFGPGIDSTPLTGDGVLDSYPWPADRPWVRAMMVTTLDGAAAGPDGLSGSVSSAVDQDVFNTVRRHADAVLIGAETMRAEQYSPMLARPHDARHRAAAGHLPAPVVVVVSGSLDLPWSLPIWSESTQPPLIITPNDADDRQLATAREHAEVITLPEVSPRAMIATLVSRGLRRIVCEGGPSMLQNLLAADVIDELNITLAPLMAGTATTPRTEMLAHTARFRLAHVLQAESFLMTRYLAEGR